MRKYTEITDALGRVTTIETSLFGKDLLINAKLNKGSAFTESERETFGLIGKLPARIETMQEQVDRHYQQYQQQPNNLAKNLFLNEMKQRNEILFYRLAMEHISEMLPIIYTPTIGAAVENFSYAFNTPQGLYFSYPTREQIPEILKYRMTPDLDLIIITDGEGVLGIGDWGIGGMDILIGKLMVYTLCGGINPRRVLPIQFDVGTNNEKLLNDPMYLGWRHKRISGKDYDDFITTAIAAIQKEFPTVFLHWEDFGRGNAHRNLDRFRNKMCTFNDDIQGTGATALACVLSGLAAIDAQLKDQRIVFLGAGTAGVGIAAQISNAMVAQGMTRENAQRCFWMVDRQGLLLDNMTSIIDFQKPYARPHEEVAHWKINDKNKIELLDVIENVNPTILIGCSTVHNAFNEIIVKTMAKYVERPLIFPLSNPTPLSEAEPADLIKWTDGKVLTATGSPFPPVIFNGKIIRIAQCNNSFIFPGLGLGIIASQANRVTDGMLAAAALALAEHSPAIKDNTAPLLPDLNTVQETSKHIALAVALQAQQEGVAPMNKEIEAKIDALFWEPKYLPYVPHFSNKDKR